MSCAEAGVAQRQDVGGPPWMDYAEMPTLRAGSVIVDDIDDVGRGAKAMLENNPERNIWGLGRHYAGSNLFWYLKDPAGNFSEYYSDMGCIAEDEIWTPATFHGALGLLSWGPPPPPLFLEPEVTGPPS